MVHIVTFRGAMVIYNRTIYGEIYNKLLYELRDTPFGRWAGSALGPVIDGGRPELPRTIYAILHNENTIYTRYNNLQVYDRLRNNKYFHMLGRTPSDHRSRALSSPGVVQGAPSLTIQNTIQTVSNAQGNYTSKNYKLVLQNYIYEQNIP